MKEEKYGKYIVRTYGSTIELGEYDSKGNYNILERSHIEKI